MKKDKSGNLVDETGKIVVSAAQNEKLVKDKDGNMVDKTTGKVVFDNTGALVADKKENAKFIARRESVKKSIMEDQIKDHIAHGGQVDGLVLDEDDKLKQVAADGTLQDYTSEPEGGIDVEKLVQDAKGNLVDPNTGKIVIDQTGNFVGESLADVKKIVQTAKAKGKDTDSIGDAIEKNGMFNKKLNGSVIVAANSNLKTQPSGRKFIKHGQKNLKSEANLKTSTHRKVAEQPNQGFSFTDESKDQRQIDAELREKYRDELGQMPSLTNVNGDGKISDAYNPLHPGNLDNPDFYRNLYKAFKMTRLAQSDNLSTKNIGPNGEFMPNYESEEFEAFRRQVKSFGTKHGGCGDTCKHLLRFYQKLGFFPMKKYEGRKSLRLPKLNMDTDFTKMRNSQIMTESDFPALK